MDYSENSSSWPSLTNSVNIQSAKYPNTIPPSVTDLANSWDLTGYVACPTSSGNIVRIETYDNTEAGKQPSTVWYFGYPNTSCLIANVFDPDAGSEGFMPASPPNDDNFNSKKTSFLDMSNNAIIIALNSIVNEDTLNAYGLDWPTAGCLAACAPPTQLCSIASIVKASDLASDEVINVMTTREGGLRNYSDPPETVAGQVTASMFQK